MLTVSRNNNNNNSVSVDTPNRDEFFKHALSDESKENILGRGSYGTVVKAVYRDQQVAVKIIDSRSQIKMWSFRNETNILGWQHENIIKILKIVSTSTYSIIIMERFPGQCLQFILDNTVIPVIHRICISIDLSNALIYCHEHGLIHLDIKPQNIIIAYLESWKIEKICNSSLSLSKLYICKLCDFGSSLKIEQQKFDNSPTNRGTIRYMSPEALKRINITTLSDIYSFGITMWQLKTRIYPYASIESNDIVAYRVVKDDLRPNCDDTITYNNKHKKNLFLTPTYTYTHTNCICQNFSSDLSKYSIENLQKILKISNSFESSLKLLQNSNNVNKHRIPFMNLNKKFNIQSCSNINNTIYHNYHEEKINCIKSLKTQKKIFKNINLLNYPKVSIKITTEKDNNEFFNDNNSASNVAVPATATDINIVEFDQHHHHHHHHQHNNNNNNNNLLSSKTQDTNKLSSKLSSQISNLSDFKNIFRNIHFHNVDDDDDDKQKNFIFTTHLIESIKIQIENDIEILYKNCWNKNYEQRPNASEIKNNLENILLKIFDYKTKSIKQNEK